LVSVSIKKFSNFLDGFLGRSLPSQDLFALSRTDSAGVSFNEIFFKNSACAVHALSFRIF